MANQQYDNQTPPIAELDVRWRAYLDLYERENEPPSLIALLPLVLASAAIVVLILRETGVIQSRTQIQTLAPPPGITPLPVPSDDKTPVPIVILYWASVALAFGASFVHLVGVSFGYLTRGWVTHVLGAIANIFMFAGFGLFVLVVLADPFNDLLLRLGAYIAVAILSALSFNLGDFLFRGRSKLPVTVRDVTNVLHLPQMHADGPLVANAMKILMDLERAGNTDTSVAMQAKEADHYHFVYRSQRKNLKSMKRVIDKLAHESSIDGKKKTLVIFDEDLLPFEGNILFQRDLKRLGPERMQKLLIRGLRSIARSKTIDAKNGDIEAHRALVLYGAPAFAIAYGKEKGVNVEVRSTHPREDLKILLSKFEEDELIAALRSQQIANSYTKELLKEMGKDGPRMILATDEVLHALSRGKLPTDKNYKAAMFVTTYREAIAVKTIRKTVLEMEKQGRKPDAVILNYGGAHSFLSWNYLPTGVRFFTIRDLVKTIYSISKKSPWRTRVAAMRWATTMRFTVGDVAPPPESAYTDMGGTLETTRKE